MNDNVRLIKEINNLRKNIKENGKGSQSTPEKKIGGSQTMLPHIGSKSAFFEGKENI